MNRLEIGPMAHDGPHCTIYKIYNRETQEPLIMKQLKRKFYSWKEIIALREIDSLRRVTDPTIIKLREVLKDGDRVNLVFEEMDCTLQEFLDRNEDQGIKVSENFIRTVIFQMATGLAKIHSENFIHRNIELENILMCGNSTIKMSDFNNCRKLPWDEPMTDYVTSRWYRAPEILIQAGYDQQCDIFSLGCVMAELYLGKPLFSGHSELDQLYLMNKVIFFDFQPQKVLWNCDAQFLAGIFEILQ